MITNARDPGAFARALLRSGFLAALTALACSRGGGSSTGGTTGSGGAPSTGGTAGSGGAPSTGGTTGSGGAPSTGGTTGSGGRSSIGGTTGHGGVSGGGGGNGGASGGGPGAGGSGAVAGNGGTSSSSPDGSAATGGRDAGMATDGSGGKGGSGEDPTVALDNLKRSFLQLQFGIWHHFGILTYTGSWAQANLPINDFNPGSTLNPQQWATAAKSAGAKFGVLTTRHHDGFALWPSKASEFNVGHVTWMNGQGDVVKAFVDGYRAEGLLPAFYYSIWDTTQTISGNLDA